MAKLTVNYENLPISGDTLKGMSLNIYDQQFFKRVLDRQDEVTQQYISDTYDTHAKLICDTVRELLDKIRIELRSIHLEIKDINIQLKEIKGDLIDIKGKLAEHEFRIGHIEKHLNL